jgi:hypothetical protein
MTVSKARIWSEVHDAGPTWARLHSRRIWRYRVPRRNGCTQGITVSWQLALAATLRHVEAAGR